MRPSPSGAAQPPRSSTRSVPRPGRRRGSVDEDAELRFHLLHDGCRKPPGNHLALTGVIRRIGRCEHRTRASRRRCRLLRPRAVRARPCWHGGAKIGRCDWSRGPAWRQPRGSDPSGSRDRFRCRAVRAPGPVSAAARSSREDPQRCPARRADRGWPSAYLPVSYFGRRARVQVEHLRRETSSRLTSTSTHNARSGARRRAPNGSYVATSASSWSLS